jgi:hypothetical protein
MALNMEHGSEIKGRLYPINSITSAIDLDRVQNHSLGISQPTEDIYEEGRENKVCSDKDIIEATASFTQLEYGEIDTWLALANLSAEPGAGISLTNFDDARTTVAVFAKSLASTTHLKTDLMEKMSIASIGLNIADGEARLERTIELEGDFYKGLQGTNKCYIRKTDTCSSGTTDYDITLSDPTPVEDPNNSGAYLLRVTRIRSGVATELVLTDDYTYSGGTLTIATANTDDEFTVEYTAGDFEGSTNPLADNDSDLCFIKADSVSVILNDGSTDVTLDKLTSLSITATFNRNDEAVIGTREKINRAVSSRDVSISLSGRVKNNTLQEILMGQAGVDHGIIDPDEFIANASLTVKIYSNSNKTTFKMGFKVTDLTFTSMTLDGTANDFSSESIDFESDNLLITAVEGNL